MTAQEKHAKVAYETFVYLPSLAASEPLGTCAWEDLPTRARPIWLGVAQAVLHPDQKPPTPRHSPWWRRLLPR